MNKIRVAFIGVGHSHVATMSKAFNEYSNLYEFVGVADYPEHIPEEFERKKQLNFPKEIELKVWEDYRELLKQNIDLAIVNSDISDHGRACEEILGMDINVLVEKPMAINMEQARCMYNAHCKSKASLFVNWPVAWVSAFRKVKEIAQSGEIGDILRVQYRSPATLGPYSGKIENRKELVNQWWYQKEKGGGSIIDYAGYGCVLTTWLIGKQAKRASGFKKNFLIPFAQVEDYSSIMLDFGDSIGFIEGSWSTVSNGEIPTGPVVYGSKGVIVSDRYDKKVRVYKTFLPYQPSPEPDEVYDVLDMEDKLPLNIYNFIKGKAPLFEMITAEFNIRAMSALDGGIRSCESGNVEECMEV